MRQRAPSVIAQILLPMTKETGAQRGGRGAGGRGQVALPSAVIKCLRIISCCPFCSPLPSYFYLSKNVFKHLLSPRGVQEVLVMLV